MPLQRAGLLPVQVGQPKVVLSSSSSSATLLLLLSMPPGVLKRLRPAPIHVPSSPTPSRQLPMRPQAPRPLPSSSSSPRLLLGLLLLRLPQARLPAPPA